jgi:hypothetical protein
LRPTRRLDLLTRSAYRRAGRLRLLAHEIRAPLTPSDRRLLSYIVIEAGVLWAEYSKAYFFCTAFRVRDAQGKRITHTESFASADEALVFAVKVARPKVKKTANFAPRDLPAWQEPGVVRKLLQAMNASTLPAWQLGMGVPTRVTADLPAMRNFFAHKGEMAAERARRLRTHYSVTQRLTPWELLCATPPLERQPLLWSWLDDLALTIELTA